MLNDLSDLYRDTYRPVRFTPARTSTDTVSDLCQRYSGGERPTSTSGDNVRQFYDDLINQPSSSSGHTLDKCSKTEPSKRKKVNEGLVKKDVKPASNTDKRMINRLLKSAQENDLKNVKICIEQGVDINCKDEYGWTPLMCASHTGANQVVRYLIQHGCDKETQDTTGRTASGIALIANKISTYELIENGEKPKLKVKAEPEDVYFCEICGSNVSGRKDRHEASLGHQLSESQQRENKTVYQLPEHNRGFQMLLRSGWSQEQGLGPEGQGQKYPVKTVLRKNRACLGHDQKTKARVTHSIEEIHHRPTTKAPKRKKEKGKNWERAMRAYMNS